MGNSANLSTQKKSIYIGYDPEKKKKKGKKKKVDLDPIESIEMKKESFGSLEVRVGVWKWALQENFWTFSANFFFYSSIHRPS